MAAFSPAELGSVACLTIAVFFAGATLSAVPIPSSPRLGHRGAERRRALEDGGLFAAIEPFLRFVAGLVALLPLGSLRARQEAELRRANYALGLTPDEYTALAACSAALFGAVALFLARLAGGPTVLGFPGAALGAMLPTLQLEEIIRRRAKEITRGLPHSIEIASMCLGAGLDFVGTLRLLSQPRNGHRDALARELALVLEELELGRTRRDALLSFADRVPTAAVRDFVLAVVQAEQKGNPLAKVIRVQGRMLGMRRSVAAEQAAARAGVLMVVPMLLLLGCILLLLMGPFIVKGIGF